MPQSSGSSYATGDWKIAKNNKEEEDKLLPSYYQHISASISIGN